MDIDDRIISFAVWAVTKDRVEDTVVNDVMEATIHATIKIHTNIAALVIPFTIWRATGSAVKAAINQATYV